jgi:hypothetical protein
MDNEFSLSPEEAEAACRTELPVQVIHGLELFNQGAYFEAHEELELAWRAERGPVRELYRGILQIAVAYYHILRGNYRGAAKMFLRSRMWLEPFLDHCLDLCDGICCGINLASLHSDSSRVEEELLRLGPERMEWLNRGLMKPVLYSSREEPK